MLARRVSQCCPYLRQGFDSPDDRLAQDHRHTLPQQFVFVTIFDAIKQNRVDAIGHARNMQVSQTSARHECDLGQAQYVDDLTQVSRTVVEGAIRRGPSRLERSLNNCKVSMAGTTGEELAQQIVTHQPGVEVPPRAAGDLLDRLSNIRTGTRSEMLHAPATLRQPRHEREARGRGLGPAGWSRKCESG